MQKRIFLVGPSCCGKTALIRRALGGALAEAGGFITQSRTDEDGRLLGCDLLPSAAAAGIEGFTPLCFFDLSADPPTRDNEVFRVTAVRLLEEAAYYPFSVLDGIGGFELVIPQFRAALCDFLSAPNPCVGTLMDLREAEALRERLGLGERYLALARRLREALEHDPDALVLETSGLGDAKAEQALRGWAEIYAR